MKGTYLNRATTSEVAVFQRSTYKRKFIVRFRMAGVTFLDVRRWLSVNVLSGSGPGGYWRHQLRKEWRHCDVIGWITRWYTTMQAIHHRTRLHRHHCTSNPSYRRRYETVDITYTVRYGLAQKRGKLASIGAKMLIIQATFVRNFEKYWRIFKVKITF